MLLNVEKQLKSDFNRSRTSQPPIEEEQSSLPQLDPISSTSEQQFLDNTVAAIQQSNQSEEDFVGAEKEL
jgi:hypothetical protein